MLILQTPSDRIKVWLNGAAATSLTCYAAYRDIDASSYSAGRNAVTVNSVTAVDMVTGGAAQRVIDYLCVLNRDSANQTVTLAYSDGATSWELFSATLAPLERIEYADGQGFRVMASNGSLKQTYQSGNNPVSSSLQMAVLGADVSNANATANTMADVTGLSFAVTAGQRYKFRFLIRYTSAATTTGSRWSVNGPASPTELTFHSQYSLTAASDTFNTCFAYDTPAASNASSAGTTQGNIAVMEGIIKASADGTVTARFASEIASSAIVAKAGSVVEWQAI